MTISEEGNLLDTSSNLYHKEFQYMNRSERQPRNVWKELTKEEHKLIKNFLDEGKRQIWSKKFESYLDIYADINFQTLQRWVDTWKLSTKAKNKILSFITNQNKNGEMSKHSNWRKED